MRVGPFEIVQTAFASFQVKLNGAVVKESWNAASCTNFVVNALNTSDDMSEERFAHKRVCAWRARGEVNHV